MRFALLGLLATLASSNLACRGGAVIWGAGETISHRADLADGLKAELSEESGLANPAIGFKYEYFSIFFLDLWTGEGEYVLYEGDRYFPLTEAHLTSIGTSSDELGKPFLFYVPLGLVAVVLLLGGFGWRTWLAWRELD